MKHLTYLAACAALAMSAQTYALGSLVTVTVVERESDTVLPTYYHHGEYWVAGHPGARYAIEIRNGAAGRLLAVTSVDGVNVLSGDTAGFDQAGYVFDPGEQYQITGWRKSNSEVAAFTFTASEDSYAARTGRPANVGIIGIALFREQPRQVSETPKVAPGSPAPAQLQEEFSRSLAADSAAIVAGAPGVSRAMPAPAPAERLGTGHGAREGSYVVDTEFHRMQREPNEVIRIRYDSLENLVAMGIIRKPHPAPRAPDAFPGSEQRHFVPDPSG
jgi:hypothetical protein